MIKRLIFDFDNTLIDWKDEYWNAVNKTFEELNLKYTKADVENVKKAIDIYEDGRNLTYNKEEMKNAIEQTIGCSLPNTFMDVWIKYLSKCIPEKIDDSIIKTLEYLSTKYELVILTNWLEESQINRLRNSGLYKFFKEVYCTENFPMKPNKESFIKAKGKNTQEECIMIGDSLNVDIKGAINAGLAAIYLNKKDVLTEEKFLKEHNVRVISKISDLITIL